MGRPSLPLVLAALAAAATAGVLLLTTRPPRGPKSEPAAASADERPERGEQLVVAMQASPATLLEPFCAVEDEITLAGLLFPSLLNLEFRGELEHVPGLADRWEVSADGRAITFTLKEAAWDDGRPIESADVVATYRLVGDARYPSPKREYLSRIEGVEEVDPRRVRFRFKAKYYLENQLADANIGILPAHVYGAIAPEDVRGTEAALRPVGHGPFRVVDRDGTRRFVLERNPRCVNARVPWLKRIVFVQVGDYEARKNALLAGEVDLVDGIRVEDLEAIERKGGFRATSRGLRGVDFLAWNHARAPFADASVRRALTLAIDRDGMNRVLFRTRERGAVAPAFGTVPPVLERAFADEVAPLPHDPAEAERLLDAAGYRRPSPGAVRARDGAALRFTLLVNSETPRRVQTARMVQQDLRKVGIDAAIESLPFDALQKRLVARDFDASVYGFNASLQLKQGDVWSAKGGFNVSGYASPEAEALVEAIREESDPARIRALLKDLQRLVDRDQPMTFLCWFSRFAVARERFRDLGADVLGALAHVDGCWVPRRLQSRFVGE